MWARVRDAVAVLVGGNAGEVAFTVLGTALGGRSPLGTRQLLLVNLLTDMFPALAVAVAAPAARHATTAGIDPDDPLAGHPLADGAARRPAARLHGVRPAAGAGPGGGHGGGRDRGVGDRPAHRLAQPGGLDGAGRADRHAARPDRVGRAAQPAGAGHRGRIVRGARGRGADARGEPVLRLPPAGPAGVGAVLGWSVAGAAGAELVPRWVAALGRGRRRRRATVRTPRQPDAGAGPGADGGGWTGKSGRRRRGRATGRPCPRRSRRRAAGPGRRAARPGRPRRRGSQQPGRDLRGGERRARRPAAGPRPPPRAGSPSTCRTAPSSTSRPVFQSETTSTPGANRSTHDPRFENGARVSSRAVAATVSTVGSRPGEDVAGVGVLVARGDRDRDAVGDEPADRGVDAVAGLAGQAEVRHRGRAAAVVAGRPVDPGDDPGRLARAVAVQRPHRDQRHRARHPARRAADRAGDVRAVPGAVVGAAPVVDRREPRPHPAAEVVVVRLDPRVDDVGGDAAAVPVGGRRGVAARELPRPLVDPVEPPGRRPRRLRGARRAAPPGQPDGRVRVDGHHPRATFDPAHPAGREHGRVAGEDVTVDERDVGPAGRGLARPGIRVAARLQPHDHRRALVRARLGVRRGRRGDAEQCRERDPAGERGAAPGGPPPPSGRADAGGVGHALPFTGAGDDAPSGERGGDGETPRGWRASGSRSNAAVDLHPAG